MRPSNKLPLIDFTFDLDSEYKVKFWYFEIIPFRIIAFLSTDIKDGGIAVWSFSDLLHDGEDEARVFSLPSPVYHWAGWDGHIGGVVDFHLDSWGLVAVNACKHQVKNLRSLTM